MMTPREAGSKTDTETDRQLVVSHLIPMKHPFLWWQKKEHAELLKYLDDFCQTNQTLLDQIVTRSKIKSLPDQIKSLLDQNQIVTRSKSNRYDQNRFCGSSKSNCHWSR
jgi:hypothetical protein